MLRQIHIFLLFICLSVAHAATPSAAGGLAHSLALAADGSVYSWGSDNVGQLGLSRTLFRTQGAPVDLPSGAKVKSLAAGLNHGLAVSTDGRVFAWGSNSLGQLGDGTMADRSRPHQVNLRAAAISVSSNDKFSAALLADGSVWLWGDNPFEELIHNMESTNVLPIQVKDIPALTQISAGSAHMVGLDAAGQVWTWGYAGNGQLGRGDNEDPSYVPGIVSLPTKIVRVIAGSKQTFALDATGKVWAWGENYYYALGDGSGKGKSKPVLLSGIDKVTALSSNAQRSAAVRSDGSLWIWGAGDYPSPTQVKGLPFAAVDVTVGGNQTLVLLSDGSVWGMGVNDKGQLSNGSTSEAFVFVKATGLPGMKSLVAGGEHVLAITQDGAAWSWGSNGLGQLGEAVDLERNIASKMPTLSNIVQVASGDNHGLALDTAGVVWAWGANSKGAVGDGSGLDRSTPVKVAGLPVIRRIAAGGNSSAAQDADGNVWVWGGNETGQLGVASEALTSAGKPRKLPDLTAIADITVGAGFMLALQDDATVLAWGDNSQGQLGVGDTNKHIGPVVVMGLSNVQAIAAGGFHGMALRADGRVWTWGSGGSSQLGNQDSENLQTIAQRVRGLLNVKTISAGRYNSLALDNNNVLYSWGSNVFGQLGRTTEAISVGRTPLAAGGENFSAVSAGVNHVVLLKNDGSTWAFGRNNAGQIGDGTFIGKPSYTGVVNPQISNFLDLSPALAKLPIPVGKRPPFLLQVKKAGSNRNLSLSTLVNLSNFAPAQISSAGKVASNAFAAANGYNVYVAALLPGKVVNGTASDATLAIFMKTALSSWQPYLGGPMTEYLNGVASSNDNKVLIDVLTDSDLSMLIGAQLLVGYGVDSNEMISAGRYRVVYQVSAAD